MAALVFIPFLAAQAVLLYSLNNGHSVIWNLVSCAMAVGLAIPGGVALIDPSVLFRWGLWELWVLPVVWEMKGFFGAFLVAPPLFVQVFEYVRSNNGWRGS
jgi:hypothetical protein